MSRQYSSRRSSTARLSVQAKTSHLKKLVLSVLGSKLLTREFVRGAALSNYPRHAPVTKLVRLFPEVLKLIEKLKEEAPSKYSSALRRAFSAT